MDTKPPTTSPQGVASPKGKKLLDQVREIIRAKHYSYRTEQTYVEWIKRFILFHRVGLRQQAPPQRHGR